MRNAAKTAFFMAVLTLISKFIGFFRELVIANYFGTTYITDAYVMAMAIPGIIFAGIWDAVVTTYTPLYSRAKETEGENKANKFTSEVINILIIVSIISSIIGFVFSDTLIALFANGFKGDTAQLASFYLKCTFSYMLFQSTAGILNSYLQYKGTFLAQIVVGYFQNFAIIVFVIISAFTNEYLLAFGGLAAWAIKCLSLVLITKKRGFRYTPNFHAESTIKLILGLAVPVFIGSSVNQINVFVDKALASNLPEGSVSALNYAMTVMGLITGLTMGIFSTIIYPKLAQANSLNEIERFGQLLQTGISLIVMVAVPFTFGAMVYSEQVVQIIYERGVFDSTATALTETAFFYYAIGMTFTALAGLFTQAFYAMHRMKMPMIFAIICVIINVVLNLTLVGHMKHNGLALATSISGIMNSMLLYIGFKHSFKDISIIESKSKIIKIVLASLIAVLCSYGVYALIITYLANLLYMRALQLAAAVIVAGLIYLVMLNVFKINEIKMLKQIINLR